MRKKLDPSEKSKLRAIALTDAEDARLLKIGDGSRTAGIKALMDLYEIVEMLGGSDIKQNKNLLLIKLHERDQKAS